MASAECGCGGLCDSGHPCPMAYNSPAALARRRAAREATDDLGRRRQGFLEFDAGAFVRDARAAVERGEGLGRADAAIAINLITDLAAGRAGIDPSTLASVLELLGDVGRFLAPLEGDDAEALLGRVRTCERVIVGAVPGIRIDPAGVARCARCESAVVPRTGSLCRGCGAPLSVAP